jgi:putative transposase
VAGSATGAACPVVLFDALRVKIRDGGVLRDKCVDRDGRRDVLALWVEQTEGAKFWMKVMMDLRNRGVEDILMRKSSSKLC